jgi:hypothetical protein
LDENTTGKSIVEAIAYYRSHPYTDIVGQIKAGTYDPETLPIDPTDTPHIPESITVPFFGEIQTQTISLPFLTFVIAALDGFNPCAMWVLIFLIGLLLGIEDKARRWTLGITFIIASGATYFLFLAAWLHSFLFIGMKTWIHIAVGLVALGSGLYNLNEYRKNQAGVCKVTADEKRQRIFDSLKRLTHENRFWIAFGGIIILAFAVNLVELFCSAGLPAVFTNILTLTEMPLWHYYAYLIFYILIFMLDDIIVFCIAMIALETTGFSGKYSKFSGLIGGILMVILGLILIFDPSLLMFG